VPEFRQHPAHFAVLALGQDQLQDRRFALTADDPGAAGSGLALGQPNPFEELVEDLLCRLARHDRLVDLLNAKLRVRQAVGQLAVVGQDHQADARLVETADGEHPFGHLRQQIDHAGAARRVGVGRDVTARLAHREIDHPLRADRLAVERDLLRLGIDARAQLVDHLAINGDAALKNQLLAGATRP
jgi:hypothetical protein